MPKLSCRENPVGRDVALFVVVFEVVVPLLTLDLLADEVLLRDDELLLLLRDDELLPAPLTPMGLSL